MSRRSIAGWVAVCAVALVAGASAAVALGAPPAPPPPPTSTPPPTSSTPPPTTTTSPPPTTSSPPTASTSTTTTPKTPTHKKHTHKKHAQSGGQGIAPAPTTPPGTTSRAADIQPAGSSIPHTARVAAVIAGGATLIAALVLAGVLLVMRGRRSGPRGPEGGHIIIR